MYRNARRTVKSNILCILVHICISVITLRNVLGSAFVPVRFPIGKVLLPEVR